MKVEQRVGYILRALRKAYPNARTSLIHDGPFQLLIATILSAQSTDETVNKVTPGLFERYPTPDALAAADPADVEAIVYPTGFFRQKTRAIIETSRDLAERFAGEVPRTLDELVTLRGVARKTGNVVLANCWPRPASDHGIFVDTHIRRVSQRLSWTSNTDPVKIERDLMALLPKRAWVDAPHQLIMLGRGPCRARNPDHEGCPLLRWCPTGRAALAASPPRPAGRRTRSR